VNLETISAAQVGAALTPLVRQPAVCRLTSPRLGQEKLCRGKNDPQGTMERSESLISVDFGLTDSLPGSCLHGVSYVL
jgi:hypothetical protein